MPKGEKIQAAKTRGGKPYEYNPPDPDARRRLSELKKRWLAELSPSHADWHGTAEPIARYEDLLLHEPTPQAVMAAIGMQDEISYVAKPHCPRCSHRQGGAMLRLKTAIADIAAECKMPKYWS